MTPLPRPLEYCPPHPRTATHRYVQCIRSILYCIMSDDSSVATSYT